MGSALEVWGWECIDPSDRDHLHWVNYYRGDDLSIAMAIAEELHNAGCGCVKIEWR